MKFENFTKNVASVDGGSTLVIFPKAKVCCKVPVLSVLHHKFLRRELRLAQTKNSRTLHLHQTRFSKGVDKVWLHRNIFLRFTATS